MNTETGEIRDLAEGEKPRDNEAYINRAEKRFLEMVKAEERPELLANLRSKNNSVKRRATKKLAKASRQRNRK